MTTPNQSPLQQSPPLSLQSVSSDISDDCFAQFSPSPLQTPSQRKSNLSDSSSQLHPHLGEDEQSAVPLFHHQTGLPITVVIHPSTPSPHPSPFNHLTTQPHPHVIPLAQCPSAVHPLLSPPSHPQHLQLPQLPLHLLPQTEDELDMEQLKNVCERLQNANNRMSPEDGVNGGKDAGRSMEEAKSQRCSGDTVGSQTPTNENHVFCATVKREAVVVEAEGIEGHEQSSLIEQQEGIGAREEIAVRPSRGADDDESSRDPLVVQVQPDDSPATNDQDEPRRTSRKRRREEVGTGYWLRSKKPPSSSKRSRRTNYWLRP